MFKENQIETANNILIKFQEGHRHQVLIAQMQIGKTGTYFLVAYEALTLKLVDVVVVITGNRDTELRDQCIQKDKETHLDVYCETHGMNMNIDVSQIELRRQLSANTHVIWGPKLKKSVDNFRQLLGKRILFIWEEAHYGQSVNQQVHKFLKELGRASVNGDNAFNEKHHSVVLTVSATPFSEVADYHHFNQQKTLTPLLPGEGYHGVEWYKEQGLFRTFPYCSTVGCRWMSTFENALIEHQRENKYFVVRTQGQENADYIQYMCSRYGYKYIEHNSKRRLAGGMDALSVRPDTPTVVHIKQMVRMGKVLPKKWIGFVFETSAKRGSNTDTLLQGLVGRMCGYDFGGNEQIKIYVPETLLPEIDRYINFYNQFDIDNNIQDFAMPIRGMNLKKGRRGNPVEHKECCVPIYIHPRYFTREQLSKFTLTDMDASDKAAITLEIAEIIAENPEIIMAHNALIKTHIIDKMNAVRQTPISEVLACQKVKVFRINKKSWALKPLAYSKLIELGKREHFLKNCNKDDIHIYPIPTNYRNPEHNLGFAEPGSAFIIIKLEALGDIPIELERELNIHRKYPETTGREVFRHMIEEVFDCQEEIENLNGFIGQPAKEKTQESFSEFRRILKRSIKSFCPGAWFSSLNLDTQEWIGILINKSAFGINENTLEGSEFERMIEEIKKETGKIIYYSVAEMSVIRNGKEYVRLERIEWR